MRAQSATFSTSTPVNPQSLDPIESSAAEPGPAESDCADLLEALRTVVDPRKRRGIRHQLVSILALAAAAVVAGARSYVAAGQWAAHAPAAVLAALDVRIDPRPSTSRVGGGVEGLEPVAYLVRDVDLSIAVHHSSSVPIAKPQGDAVCDTPQRRHAVIKSPHSV